MQHQRVVAAGTYGGNGITPAMIKAVKGSSGNRFDRGFLIIALLSIIGHSLFLFFIRSQEVTPAETVVIEEVPERFAKLIIEKPIPKEIKQQSKPEQKADQSETTISKSDQTVPTDAPITPARRAKAKKKIEDRAVHVEKKMRTVGVLGMLTGVGTTAKGPSVVDVLGAIDKKEKQVDLDAALDNVTGLKKTENVDVLSSKIVKSKELNVSRHEDIDNLLASVGKATTIDLAKKGSFIIQKPESIEGAASSNTKRDNNAINAIVASHKTSIRMSYERYLKRDPTLSGKVTVRFTIAASGKIARVTVIENTTGNTALENEIIRKIKFWKFEEIAEGDVTVTYPFVFAPAG